MPAFARLSLPLALLLLAASALADPLTPDKREALAEFSAAYRLSELWPQMAPKIAHDSLARLEDATHAAIDADPLSKPAADAAHARVPALLPAGRKELEAALQAFDADELAAYTAYSIYARYFETAEIRTLTAFFASDTGRKLTTLAPTILAESRRAGGGDTMQRHFSEDELREITAFWNSPVGLKMSRTADQVREDMHEHFIERSEPGVQAVAHRLAARAEAGAASTPAP
jgi:hypothetical protein